MGAPNTRSPTCKTPPQWPPARRSLRRRKKKVAAEPERYELHHQDETHVETNPYLCKVWHRRGVQPTLPAAGTNRRVTVFGSVEALGRGRVEVICAGQDSACFLLYLAALERRHVATGREVYLVLDNGPAHTSKVSLAALEERAAWLHVIWLARYSPELNPKEREWKVLKRDVRGHLAATLRAFVDEIGAGLGQLGGTRIDVVDQVPAWFIAGHRKPPTGRPPGRPKGAKDSYKRAPSRKKEVPLPVAA